MTSLALMTQGWIHPVRHWRSLSQVERVTVYTRDSLYLVMWGTGIAVVLQVFYELDDSPGLRAGTLLAGLVLNLAATVVMRDVIALYPRTGPLPWRSIGPFVGLLAVTVAASVVIGDNSVPTLMFAWIAAAWSLAGLADNRVVTVVMVALALLPAVAARDLRIGVIAAAAGIFFIATVRLSLWLLAVVTELDDARGAQSALAVAEERLRFSRDVHDVLGRRLSTIAVQAELAATLARRGDDSAADRMLDVRSVAHDALREARELARGYRATDLAQELEGARSLLRSAGIALDTGVDDLPPPWHEAAGWVVREAVTNVLRHSDAKQVSVTYADGLLTVTNDGVDAPPEAVAASGGSGLVGLRERLAPVGGTLETARTGSTFVLSVSLPGAAPEEKL